MQRLLLGGPQMIALGVLSLVLHGCAFAEPASAAGQVAGASPSPSTAIAALEHAVHERVNRHRRARGLAPLDLDSRVARQARLHSQAMAAGTTPFGHDGFEGRVEALRRVMSCARTAENVASNQGHRDPASEAVRGWLESRGHRQNIEGRYELTGVGVARNRKGEVFFTQIFVGR
jgi:uncharacterized protein YkwD